MHPALDRLPDYRPTLAQQANAITIDHLNLMHERYKRATGMDAGAYARHAHRRTGSLLRHANLSTLGRVGDYGPTSGYPYPAWIDAHRRHESLVAAARVTSGYVIA